MSTSIGAPAALARSLGHSDMTKGVAAAIAPMPPTTEVAPIRKRRLSLLTIASFAIPALRSRAAKPVDYTGFGPPVCSVGRGGRCFPLVEQVVARHVCADRAFGREMPRRRSRRAPRRARL